MDLELLCYAPAIDESVRATFLGTPDNPLLQATANSNWQGEHVAAASPRLRSAIKLVMQDPNMYELYQLAESEVQIHHAREKENILVSMDSVLTRYVEVGVHSKLPERASQFDWTLEELAKVGRQLHLCRHEILEHTICAQEKKHASLSLEPLQLIHNEKDT